MKQIITRLRRHWMPLLAINSALLAGTIYAVGASTTIPSVWKANAELNIPQSTDQLNSSLGSLGNVQNVGLDFKNVNPLQIQLSILTSDIVLERVRKMDPEGDSYARLNDYKELFVITPQEVSTIIALEAKASHPQLAADRLSMLIQVYQERLNELRHNDANVREQFAQDELNKSRNNLIQVQTQLSKFQKATGITDIAEQSKGLIASINGLKTAKAQAIAQAQANETQAQVAAANLNMTPAQALNSLRLGENQEYQAIRTKVAEVETALAEARGIYTDESPLVQSLLVRRQELRRILAEQKATALPGGTNEPVDTTLGGNAGNSRLEMIAELTRARNTAKGLYQQANQIQTQINKLNAELSSITSNQGELTELQRRYEIAEGAYKGIIAQIQQTKTNPFSVYPNVQVLDQPTIDTKPLQPSQKLIVFGGAIAAIFGSIALIIFLEGRNPMLRPKDLQQIELPILGKISRLKRPNLEKHLEAEIEIDFQRLASAILMAENNRLMITSSTAGEGKTTVTLGLALALVNFGFRVLIVDGDLRQAEMSRRLGHLPAKVKADDKPTLVPICAGLDLIPAPLIPKAKVAKYFASGEFEESFRPLADSNAYDYVLVDSPPISLASESTMINAAIRDVLFVVRSGKSDRHSVMDSLEQLNWHHARVMGLIVNSVDFLSEGYRYGNRRELQEAEG
ncbi:GumC family protein [Aliterella atlantica]|uniref:Lipopolysaccharide biosynthesis protein n=1 Tax=Aliterella atlantica CENA595 TaxID=1618023 RepID=A0A0D8ZPS6_9CYAN|nr:polysaccharide biosynthesis tyrosine autokinase [Aliterella atlantica]KJH70352.1 lipopolysaccharide biosynthesis protein [Aliterella atlantica CENA595]